MAIKSLVGFVFEGVGLNTSKTGGLCLAWGTHTPHPSSTLEWVDALIEPPQGVSTEVNPFTGEWSTSARSVRIDASDRLARLFLSDQRRASMTLAIAIGTPSTTSVNLDTTLADALDGTVIWVDDEAILLGTHTSAGTYTGCTRGLWGTQGVTHSAGALVYRRIPGWEHRLVRLVEHNVETGVEITRWRGLVRNIVADGSTITIDCDEYLAALTRAAVNRGARDLAIGMGAQWETRSGRSGLTAGALAGYRSTVRPTSTSGLWCFVEVDGIIGQVLQERLDGSLRFEVAQGGWLFGQVPDVDAEGLFTPYEGSIWEVLVVTPNPSLTSIDVGTYPDAHPLTVALALLTSSGTGRNGTFDVLGAGWGLGLDVVNLTTWTDEIDRTPQLEVDHLVLGAGGEPVNVLQVVQDTLLRPFGYFLAIDVEGRLSLARLRMPTIADAQAADVGASAYPGQLILDRALGEQAQEISATIGGTPGTGDGAQVTIKEPDRVSRRGVLGDVRQHRLDLQTLRPQRLGNPRRSASFALAAYASLLALGLDTSPRLTVRVADHTITGTPAPDLGAWIRLADLGPLQDAWLVDAEGERIEASDGAAWIGLVIGRDWSITDHSYTLKLLMVGWRVGQYVRERAPAAEVVSWNAGTNTLTVAADTFAGDPSDAQTFSVGDEVRLCAPDLEPYAVAPRAIIAITSTTIQLDGSPGITPAAGDLVQLAYTNEYANNARYPITDRPYAAMVDVIEDAMELPDSGFDPPDIYGSSVYGGA